MSSFATNTTKTSSRKLVDKLNAMGFGIQEHEASIMMISLHGYRRRLFVTTFTGVYITLSMPRPCISVKVRIVLGGMDPYHDACIYLQGIYVER